MILYSNIQGVHLQFTLLDNIYFLFLLTEHTGEVWSLNFGTPGMHHFK